MATRSALEERLGVKFKDPALLHLALVHSSYLNENPDQAPQSNERLEYLGDAVLGLLVADDLFSAYPDLDEGRLTELRTQLVRRDTLAKAARRLNLGEALLLGRGEEGGGGRGRPTNLAHAYEAVVGAVRTIMGDWGVGIGARNAGRSPGDVEVASLLPCALSDDRDAARDLMRQPIAS